MDGNPDRHVIARPATESLRCRCAWCGLALIGAEAAAEPATPLCDACSEILRGVDWRPLLARKTGSD
ncbi:MAG TPA: hypothetical protein VMC10_00920 [Stellaceae bacterium]|nr:hypothetical protein [Stellaceae bacterium]